MKSNFMLDKLRRGETVIGTWNTIASTNVTDIIASTGIDFVVIDFEHGPFDLSNVMNYVNACEYYAASPIVRIPRNVEWIIQQVLDQGAHGIITPHIETGEGALKFSRSTKFSPLGVRGFTPFTKAGEYSGEDNKSFIKSSNDQTFSMTIVESAEGLENIDEISKCENLDAIYFGSYDISQSLGVPGETRHEKVIKAITEANRVAQKNGKYTGAFLANSNEDIDWIREMGFNIIMYSVDSAILKRAIGKAVIHKNKRVK